jgi:hypothetical protein
MTPAQLALLAGPGEMGGERGTIEDLVALAAEANARAEAA